MQAWTYSATLCPTQHTYRITCSIKLALFLLIPSLAADSYQMRKSCMQCAISFPKKSKKASFLKWIILSTFVTRSVRTRVSVNSIVVFQELASLLQEPLQPKFSQRFFTGQPSAALLEENTEKAETINAPNEETIEGNESGDKTETDFSNTISKVTKRSQLLSVSWETASLWNQSLTLTSRSWMQMVYSFQVVCARREGILRQQHSSQLVKLILAFKHI